MEVTLVSERTRKTWYVTQASRPWSEVSSVRGLAVLEVMHNIDLDSE